MHNLIRRYAERHKFTDINSLTLLVWRNTPNWLRQTLVGAYYSTHRHRLPEKRFLIFAQGRTGSSLLVDLLNSHPQISCLGEIFDEAVVANVHRPEAFAAGLCCLSTNRASGFKVKIYQIQYGQRREPGEFLRLFHRRGWRIIYLRRMNLFRHAISDIRSEKTRIFHKVEGQDRPEDGRRRDRKVVIRPWELFRTLNFRRECLQQEEEALAGLPYCLIEYERDLLEPQSKVAAMGRLYDFLGLSPHEPETAFRKVTSRDLSDSVENCDELLDAVSGTDWEEYLHWG